MTKWRGLRTGTITDQIEQGHPMKPTMRTAKQWILRAFVLAIVASTTSTTYAQLQKVTYNLENVMLLPDISDPGAPAQPMTGAFEWTYQLGDFENGVGQFTEMNMPWYGNDYNSLIINIDLTSIEFTLPGNFHDRGVDVTLFLLDPLSPNQPATIDTINSIFEIQQGPTHQGHAISGAVVPVLEMQIGIIGTCPVSLQISINNVTPNGKVALLYGFDQGSFVIPNGFPCAGVTLGLQNQVTLGATLQADANGDAMISTSVPASACGNVYLQALDLANCGISGVALLQ